MDFLEQDDSEDDVSIEASYESSHFLVSTRKKARREKSTIEELPIV